MGRQVSWLCALTFMIVSSASAWTVKDVHFAVDGQEDVPFLHGVANLKRGEEFSYKKIDESLARLGQTGRFRYLESRVSQKTGEVFFVLRSIYKIRNVNFDFSGTKFISSQEINDLEEDLKNEILIKPGDPVDLGLLSIVNNQVVERVSSRGYQGSESVTLFEDVIDSQYRDLVVSVKLGNPTWFKEIIFEGFSEAEKSRILSQYSSALDVISVSRAIRNALLPKSEIRMDLVELGTILEAYQKNLRESGYYDSRIDYEADFELGHLKLKQFKGALYSVNFKGIRYFWERFLRDKALERVQSFSVPFDPNDVASQVSDLYRQVGFKDVKVQWKLDFTTKKNKDSENRYVFTVSEGEQFYLGDVVFLGGIGREESQDAELAKSEWIFENSDPLHFIYFDESSIKLKVGSLLKSIRDKGYIEAKIVDLRFEPSEGLKNRINLVVNLQIGQKFYIESVSISGLSFIDAKVRESFLRVKPGDVVVPSKVAEINSEIEQYLKNHGFIEARVESSEDLIFRKRPTFNKVDLVFQAESGPKVLVGKFVIEGNESTKSKVIERELYDRTLVPGQPWSLQGERRLRENLLSLGIFGSASTEKIAGRVVGEDPVHNFEIQQKDLKVTLRERPAGSIEFGPGYRTDLGMIGFAEFNYRNLFGENYGFLTRAQISRKLNNFQFWEQRYSITLLDPYFVSQRVRLRTSLSYFKEDDTVFLDGVAVRGLSLEEINLGLNAEFLLADKWTWIQNVYTISSPRIFGIIDSDSAAREGSQRYRIGTMGSSLLFDGRDNIFNPTRGWYSVSAFEFASPELGSNADVNFATFRQELIKYIKTGPGSVIALSGEYSRLWGLSNSERGVPENKRLYLGGQSSLRFLPDKTLRYDEAGVQGQQAFEFKAEYRQPWIYDLSVAFFVDLGRLDVLSPKALDHLSSGWREGLGLGLRYATPVGPIALDFAFNIDPEPNESNYQIQFSIGVF